MLLTVVALALFSRERLPIETTSALVIAVLTLGFVLFPYEADGQKFEIEELFLGFGNEALITICSLMMAGYGLVRTGALTPIGRWTARLWSTRPHVAMIGMLTSTALISA